MGLTKRDKVTYLKCTEGKLRMKTTKEDPEAEARYVEMNGTTLYEKVFTTCEGYVRDIKVQTHEEYGTSYNLMLFDPNEGEMFSINIGEASRYFASFVECLPNIDFSVPLEVRPYMFKQDGKQNIGISFKQRGEKVANAYKDFDEDKKKSVFKGGLEKFNFNKVKGDKEETKILQMKLLKWLRAEMQKELIRLKEHLTENPELPDPTVTGAEAQTDEVEAPPKEEKKAGKAGKKKGKKSKDDDLPY